MLPRTLLIIGLIFIFLAGIFYLSGRFPSFKSPLGRLPGDILIKKENFSFYFPLTTGILISIVLSLLFYFFRK